jgi:ribosomal protein S18 acetylase RimI-like enzyme
MTMNIKIIAYENQYRAQIIKLFEDFQDYLVELDPLKRLRRLPGYGEQITEKTLKEMDEQHGAFYLAVDAEKVVGFIVGIVQMPPEKEPLDVIASPAGRITELYVTREYRGQGIATQLMQTVEAYLKASGCAVAKVEVFVPNEAAKNLYKKFGYEPRDIDNMKKL